MKNTAIEWAHHTVNFWWGCTFARLLDGSIRDECIHCYALAMSKFFSKGKATWGENGKRMLRVERAGAELHSMAKAAKKAGVRHRVFINSMSDTFEDRRDLDEAREYMWTRFEEVGYALDILLLTKRPENACKMVPKGWLENWPSHVWVGTTAGTQKAANEAIPHLLTVPAKIRFLSMEPLLENVVIGAGRLPALTGIEFGSEGFGSEVAKIDWVIVGGESGPKARPMHPDWARSLRDQCKSAGVPFFFKQWGEWFPGFTDDGFYFDDCHGGIPDNFPEKFKVHAFPPEADNTFQEMARIGKKNTGRLLDGVDHSAVPSS